MEQREKSGALYTNVYIRRPTTSAKTTEKPTNSRPYRAKEMQKPPKMHKNAPKKDSFCTKKDIFTPHFGNRF